MFTGCSGGTNRPRRLKLSAMRKTSSVIRGFHGGRLNARSSESPANGKQPNNPHFLDLPLTRQYFSSIISAPPGMTRRERPRDAVSGRDMGRRPAGIGVVPPPRNTARQGTPNDQIPITKPLLNPQPSTLNLQP